MDQGSELKRLKLCVETLSALLAQTARERDLLREQMARIKFSMNQKPVTEEPEVEIKADDKD